MIYDRKAVSYEYIHTFGFDQDCFEAVDLHLRREIMSETRASAINTELWRRLNPCVPVSL